jgi:hypothetical protein
MNIPQVNGPSVRAALPQATQFLQSMRCMSHTATSDIVKNCFPIRTIATALRLPG